MATPQYYLGIMSGTSLDGLDIVAATFNKESEQKFTIDAFNTYEYDERWNRSLHNAPKLDGRALRQLDLAFGKWIGEKVSQFIDENKIPREQIVAVASHGHTVFHEPVKGYTLQIGNGQAIQKSCRLTVVNDFRTADVLAGGQGAPLVPLGDRELFTNQADAFVNLGGFCNISYQVNGKWEAFDIAPCNLPLNMLAQRMDMSFDVDGLQAAKGDRLRTLMMEMDSLDFYQQRGPKSLGTEWLEEHFTPLLDHHISTPDLLASCVEHIAMQIGSTLKKSGAQSCLLSGGGALNKYLVERIKKHAEIDIRIPSREIINYKEALIFAFLGYRRLENQVTTLAEVTGASSDLVTGVVYPA